MSCLLSDHCVLHSFSHFWLAFIVFVFSLRLVFSRALLKLSALIGLIFWFWPTPAYDHHRLRSVIFETTDTCNATNVWEETEFHPSAKPANWGENLCVTLEQETEKHKWLPNTLRLVPAACSLICKYPSSPYQLIFDFCDVSSTGQRPKCHWMPLETNIQRMSMSRENHARPLLKLLSGTECQHWSPAAVSAGFLNERWKDALLCNIERSVLCRNAEKKLCSRWCAVWKCRTADVNSVVDRN